MGKHSIIACSECDQLQRETSLPPGGAAYCCRCEALLYRNTPNGLERTLAFTLAAAVLFLIANAFPILGLEVQGRVSESTLLGAVRSLYDQDMWAVAVLVLMTTIIVPAAELTVLSYLLIPIRMGRVPRGMAILLRLLQAVRPWGMVEVFMLGVLVSLVKLASLASVVTGPALWSFGALILLLAAAAASFNTHDLWALLIRADRATPGALR